MLNTVQAVENIRALNRRDALVLADAIVWNTIAALQRDHEIPYRSFAQWELALANLHRQQTEEIACVIVGYVDLSEVIATVTVTAPTDAVSS
jgi:hypothetical protein